jgi:DNA primase
VSDLEDVLAGFPAPVAARLRRAEVVAAQVPAAAAGRVAFVGVHPVGARFKVARFEVPEERLAFDLTPDLLEDEEEVDVTAGELVAALKRFGIAPEQLRSPMRAGYPV